MTAAQANQLTRAGNAMNVMRLMPPLAAAVMLLTLAPGPWTDAGLAGHGLIVAGLGIGPFRLGMTAVEMAAAARGAPCTVAASYEQGKAQRLETNCGGAYVTPDRITVGLGLEPLSLWRAYGPPQEVTASNAAGVRGEWLRYTSAGIAFRVVYSDARNGLIQAIAVFKGSGLRPRVPAVAPPPGAPPPSVNE